MIKAVQLRFPPGSRDLGGVIAARGRVVADDIDPKRTSIEEVERVITGMAEHEARGTAAPVGA